MFLLNPDWLKDRLTDDEIKKAIDALLAYRRFEVLKAIVFLWSIVLILTFTGIVTVRFAFWI
jgi:hypothetical protein